MTAPALEEELPAGLVLEEVEDLAGGYASAVFDTAGAYRYLLTRIWDRSRPVACWVMLNPSTADHAKTDNTLTRVVDFSGRFGCGGLAIANLFAVRSRHPEVLTRHASPVGEHNDVLIRRTIRSTRGGPVIAAWGTWGHKKALRSRTAHVTALLAEAGIPVRCLGVSSESSGHQPLHPLMLEAHTRLQDYLPAPENTP